MDKWFGVVSWYAKDVIVAAEGNGITLTNAQAEKWLEKNECWFKEMLTEYGIEVLASVGRESFEEVCEVKNESREYEIELELKVCITTQDIDDIMCAALEGGITGWCCAAKPVGKILGEYGHEQIAHGGSLMLYDAESNDKWELTLDKFLQGLAHALEGGVSVPIDVENGTIDTSNVDATVADAIVQYALFGEVVFG